MNNHLKLSDLRSALQQAGVELSDEQYSNVTQDLEGRLPKESEYNTWADYFARGSSVTNDFVEILNHRNGSK